MKGGHVMLKANLEAEIEAKEKELYRVDQDIWKMANIIAVRQVQQSKI